MPACLFILCLLLSGFAAAPAAATTGLPPEVEPDWWSQVQRELQATEYHIRRIDDVPLEGVRSAYHAPNREQDLRIYFTEAGILVVPRSASGRQADPPWRWGLTLDSYGFEGNPQPVAKASLHPHDNRIEYRRAELIEWYVNGARGLEQGFTVLSPPAPAGPGGDETLVMSFEVEGGLVTRVEDDARSVRVTGAGPGAADLLHFGGLIAFDADDTRLPVAFRLQDGRLQVRVEVADARYPVIVDPLLTSAGWGASGGQAEARYGYSVAVAGDVNGDGYSDIVVGAPDFNDGAGAVFVYHGSPDGLPVSPDWSMSGAQTGARFGASVATAGDVNGDGYSDLLIGAPGFDDDAGAVFLHYGSSGGLSPSPDWSATGGQAGMRFGAAVATAGDVNGDGYSDVIIGAPGFNGDTGAAFVYHGSASGPASVADWNTAGTQGGARFAAAVATAGDVNGDGYSDIIIGAPGLDDGNQSDAGAAFVHYGSVNGLSATPGWSATGGEAGARFGAAVATAGDVNGDGYSDVIIGAPGLGSGNQSEAGGAFVHYGSAVGLSVSPGWTATGGEAGAHFGAAVATAGDVNGDGYSDLLIGAPGLEDDGLVEAGGVFVYYGAQGGPAATADWTATGDQAGARFGAAVATAGDINGSGFSDVIIGAPDADDGGLAAAGSAAVFYGSPDDPSTQPDWQVHTDQNHAEFGWSVSSAGDVNGDGYGDVIVGAPKYDNGNSNEGAAFVYYGSPDGLSTEADWSFLGSQGGARFGWSVATAGDVNGDGYSDVIIGAPSYNNGQTAEGAVFLFAGSAGGLATVPATILSGDQSGAQFGWSVSSAGDVNGDGYSDVIIGAPEYNNGSLSNTGAAFVYYGSAEGLSATTGPNWFVKGDQAGAQFGYSVDRAGDVDADGYSDIIIGAPFHAANAGAQGGQTDEGAVFVYYGSASGPSTTVDWQVNGHQQKANFGWSVATAGDVNGDGYSDVIIGAPFFDDTSTNEGAAFVYYGTSNGLSATFGDQVNAQYGISAVTAGDVNGDGYSDVIIGSHRYNNGRPNEGAAFIYYGSAEGIGETHDWMTSSNQVNAQFGISVSTAGDVNGDGFDDLIIGAHLYDNGNSGGGAFVYYGNRGGPDLRPRMRRSDDSAPIVTGTSTFGATDFQLSTLARSPLGRGHVELEWEVKPYGVPFDGTDTGRSGFSTATGGALGAVEISQLVGGLVLGELYHWRMRLRHDPVTSPFRQTGRWLSPSAIGWEEMAFRTDAGTIPLLIVSSTSLPSGTQDAVYNHQLSAEGGMTPYQWSVVSGELPAGLGLSPEGEFEGIPAETGSFSFVVEVTDAASNTDTLTFSLTIQEAQPVPTAVNLIEFSATVENGGVLLRWETGAEIDNAGFRLLRSDHPDGQGASVNGAGLIPARGGVSSGAVYRHVDETPPVNGDTYYYTLVDVDTSGVRTPHGPLAVVLTEGSRAEYAPPTATGVGSGGSAGGAGALGGSFLLLLIAGVLSILSRRDIPWRRSSHPD